MKRLQVIVYVLFLLTGSCLASPPAEVLLYSTKIEATGQSISYKHVRRILIRNKQGEVYTSVALPFSGKNKPSNISASIYDLFGNTRKTLKKKDIAIRSNLSDFAFFEDDFIAEFTLSYNQYPYILEYTYTEKVEEYIHIINWVPLISLNIPTNKAELEIFCAKDISMNYVTNLVTEQPQETNKNGTTYKWQAEYTEQVESETKSPPIRNSLPQVRVAPEEFNYSKPGKLTSWKSFGQWQMDVNAGLLDLPESEKVKVDKLLEGIDSDIEKMKVLYDYLQEETRYIYVGIDEGGLVPYPASYVCQNKYGDCKALSNYYIALLQYAGIKAYYSKVYADEKVHKIKENLPSSQFNHIIVSIPVGTDTIWVDCTTNAPFGYIGTSTQNRKSLVVSENSTLFKTPVLTPDDVCNVRNIVVDTRKEPLTVTFNNEFRGDNYELFNQLLNTYSTTEMDRIVRDYLIEEGFELNSYQIDLHHKDSSVIKIRYEASNNSLVKKYGNDILLKEIPFDIPEFEDPVNRKMPVQIDFPINKVDTIQYLIDNPEIKLPEEVDISSKYGSYHAKYELVDDSLFVFKSVKLLPGYYELTEYSDFFDYYKKVEKSNQKYIVLTN